MRIFLCGNTGVENRGCEAIVRSTVPLLQQFSGDITLATFNERADRAMAKELGINTVAYRTYPTPLHRYACGALRKINPHSLAGQGMVQRPLFELLRPEDVCLNIGGDIYCYSRPTVSLALNRYTQKKHIKNILWCCSVEKDNINEEIFEDLTRYHKIFARENITYQTLLDAGLAKEKIVKCCDPAFLMKMKPTALPEGFEEGNTVGINLSPLVFNEKTPKVKENVFKLFDYLLNETKLHICLIPHVYNIEKNTNDYSLLKALMERYQSERISMVEQELDCEQLKYIISKCSYFIGARTHATIAAYSTLVPTLVLGYSVKSKGIATDLFGTYKGYVLPYTEMDRPEELTQAFKKIVANARSIREQLKTVMPAYTAQLTGAIKEHILSLDTCAIKQVCATHLCTGCGACVYTCAAQAIAMKADAEGFFYPVIDQSKCVQCGKCRKVCPVVNRTEDTIKEPLVYTAQLKDETALADSSSGGVFYALAKKVLEAGGTVFGAAYDLEHKRVIHTACERLEDLPKLQGSKYVQSELQDTFSQIKALLKKQNLVLFCGTPCQVEGLKAFLGKEYKNLFTVDFICHSVASPRAFKEYLCEMERQYHAELTDFCMRNKALGWQQYGFFGKLSSGEEFFEKAADNPYFRAYIMGLFDRECCAHCAFKKIARVSDITLGDAWGMANDFDAHLGVSCVCLHSEKAKIFFDSVKELLQYEAAPFSQLTKNNPSYEQKTKPSDCRSALKKKAKNHKNLYLSATAYIKNSFFAKLKRAYHKLATK